MSDTKSPLVLVLIIFGGLLVSALALVGFSYVGAYNSANSLEKSITATYANNQNILAQYGQKISEATQVPEMQRDDIAKLIHDAMEGRYGAEGSKAVFQAISESNPSVNPQLYTKLQQMIESGRNEFSVAQTGLLDKKRVYETQLDSFWTGAFMRVAGYPKIKLDDYKMITTDRAAKTFETGREAPMQLRTSTK